MLLVGTDRALTDLDTGQVLVSDASVTWLAAAQDTAWALLDRRRVVRIDAAGVAELGAVAQPEAQSVAPLPDGSVVLGLSGARLVRLADGTAEPIPAFERVPGRDDWENPANPTPDTRSMSVDDDGTLWVNVHVGGVWSSTDRGASWTCVIEPADDVHEVRAGSGGRLAAAAAVGFGWSRDGGRSWSWSTEGLQAHYCRAVALDGDTAFVTASTGPWTRRGAAYRARLGEPFERCEQGLPGWFADNVDTGCLDAAGGRAAFGSPEGAVYLSDDAGESWAQVAGDLGRVSAIRML
jgi:hypothetical protein